MSNTWTTITILTSPNFWGMQSFLLFIIKEKLLLSIWISQVPCVYPNFTSSKVEDILCLQIPSLLVRPPEHRWCLFVLQQTSLHISMAENPFNEEKKKEGFPLMKNHTKYFSSHIRIFNFKRSVSVFSDHCIGWKVGKCCPRKKNWACKFIFLVSA